jgi:hypothetical protein
MEILEGPCIAVSQSISRVAKNVVKRSVCLRARYGIRLRSAGSRINSPERVGRARPQRTGAVVYLYVSDADAVRAEWASCGVEGRLGEARNTDYGMREFGFVDTDGTLHRVGSKLP